MLLAVPNFSEGRDAGRIKRIAARFGAAAELLDSHSDPVHNRTVLTLGGSPSRLGESLVSGASACVEEIDMREHEGAHPCIGALDVCPMVWTSVGERSSAADHAMAIARAIAASGVPVFLYGALATSAERRERAHFREGGLEALRERMGAGELRADLGPTAPHPSAGATLVTARAPIAAFNVVLEGAGIEHAREVAARLRESGGGLPGVRAIAVDLGDAGAQISTNVHDPLSVPLGAVVERIAELGRPAGARPSAAEIVGLVPEEALAGFPGDLALPGFDRGRQVLRRPAEDRVEPAD